MLSPAKAAATKATAEKALANEAAADKAAADQAAVDKAAADKAAAAALACKPVLPGVSSKLKAAQNLAEVIESNEAWSKKFDLKTQEAIEEKKEAIDKVYFNPNSNLLLNHSINWMWCA